MNFLFFNPFLKHVLSSAIAGKVWVSKLSIAGDEQHHKKYHGGKFRPILAYSAEHYPRWRAELGLDFPYGGFAENFTISGGLDEHTACLGDVFWLAIRSEFRCHSRVCPVTTSRGAGICRNSPNW